MAATVLDSIESLFLRCDDVTSNTLPTVREEEETATDIVVVSSSSSSSPANVAASSAQAPTHANDLEDLDRYIDNEMELRKTAIGMTWRKLDKCFKWQAMQSHLDDAGISQNDDIRKRAEELLKSNELATSVEYSKEEKKILRINHPDFVSIY
jgi:hypothetical protein